MPRNRSAAFRPGGNSTTNHKPLFNMNVMSLHARKNVNATTVNVPDVDATTVNATTVNAENIVTKSSFKFAQVDSQDLSFNVLPGNPDSNNPNQYGGIVTDLSVCDIDGTASRVLINFSIVGEWDSDRAPHDKGVALARYTSDTVGGFYGNSVILRAPGNQTGGLGGGNDTTVNARFIQNFTSTSTSDDDYETMETCNGMYIDSATVAGKFYKYYVLLVSSNGQDLSANFTLNTVTDLCQNNIRHEMGISNITSQEF